MNLIFPRFIAAAWLALLLVSAISATPALAQGVEPEVSYNARGADHACNSFSSTETTFAAAFAAVVSYTHAFPYLASLVTDTCSTVTAQQQRFSGSCTYIYSKTSEGGSDNVGGIVGWLSRCPDNLSQNPQTGLCLPDAPYDISLSGPSDTKALPAGPALPQTARVTRGGAAAPNRNVSVSMDGATASGTTDGAGEFNFLYTPPFAKAALVEVSATCDECANTARKQISVQACEVCQ